MSLRRRGLFLLGLLCLHHACASDVSISGAAVAASDVSAGGGAGDQVQDGELQELRRVMPGGPARRSRVRQMPPGVRPTRPPSHVPWADQQQPAPEQQQQPAPDQQPLQEPVQQQQPEQQEPEHVLSPAAECRAMQFNVAGMCVHGSLQCLQANSQGQVGSVSSVYGYDNANAAYAAAVDAAAQSFTVAFYATTPTRIDAALPDGTALSSTWVVPEDCDARTCAACATRASSSAAVVSTQGQAFVGVTKPAGASLVRVSLHSPCRAACESGSWNMVVFCSGAHTKFPACGSKRDSSP